MAADDIFKLFDESNPVQKPVQLKHKDWTGSQSSVFKTLAASNHTDAERKAFDYYATHPVAGELLMMIEKFSQQIWEPACGEGHLSSVFTELGFDVKSTDLVNRGFGEQMDFLSINNTEWIGDIITNPPYSYAKEFIQKALSIIPDGNKVAMFLKITFLESQNRAQFFRDTPPIRIWVSSNRIPCAKNGDFVQASKDGSAVCYAWFIWKKGFQGKPTVDWFN